MGTMYYTEAQGFYHPTTGKSQNRAISIANYQNDLENLRTDIKNYFRHKHYNEYKYEYYGTYSRVILPSIRASIVSTAQAIGDRHIEYTIYDMIDAVNHWQNSPPGWYENWDGTINDIDEIRCDGVVEYSYEKNNIMVSNNDYIALSGNNHLTAHNDLHTYGYNLGELCPKIQAGENCNYYSPGSGTSHSLFDPLISSDPTIGNFSTMDLDNIIQLNFKAGDNASVKDYVLLQVKKSNESTWRALIDKNNKLWKFRTVDLTEWNGNEQYDYFHIPWTGRYENGCYTSGTYNFDLKIAVIDQGANSSEEQYSFTYTVPPLTVAISGPAQLDYMENGTFTANPSYGSGTYTNYRWWWRNDDGGGGPSKAAGSNDDGGTPMYAPPGGTWYILSGQEGNQSITISKPASFFLKCEVMDSYNHTATDIHSIYVNPNLSKKGNTEVTFGKEDLPTEYDFFGTYPNPFNPSTTIEYALPYQSTVNVEIYNIKGQKVNDFSYSSQNAGNHHLTWNGQNRYGAKAASGLYIIRFKAESLEGKAEIFQKSLKVIMLK
jgi:hypothetical protein